MSQPTLNQPPQSHPDPTQDVGDDAAPEDGSESVEPIELDYWPNKTDLDLATEITQRVEDWFKRLPSLIPFQRWASGWRAYCGLPSSSGSPSDVTMLSFMGNESEMIRLKVNHIGALGRAAVQTVTSNRPELNPVPVNDDYSTDAQLAAAKSVMGYFFKEAKLEKKRKLANEIAIACGMSWMSATWSETAGEIDQVDPKTGKVYHYGEFQSKAYMPWNVVTDLHRDDSEHVWGITIDKSNKYDLAATYPTAAAEILQAEDAMKEYLPETKDNTLDPKELESDLISVFTLYHAPSPACPAGRWAVCISKDILLGQGPLPYKRLPLFRHSGGEILNTSFGDSPIVHGLSIQTVIDEIASAAVSNELNLNRTNVMGFKGVEITRTQIAEGYEYTEADPLPGTSDRLPIPQSYNLAKSAPSTLPFLEMLAKTIGTVTGIGNVVSGQDPSLQAKLSGAALVMLESQTIRFLSSLQASDAEMMEGVGSAMLDILKTYAKKKKLIRIAGEGKQFEMREFVGSDLEGFDRLEADIGTPNMNSPAVNMQLADNLLAKVPGFSAKDYMRVFLTGRLESMTDRSETQILNLKRENSVLMKGGSVQPLLTDDHLGHIDGHASLLDNPDAREDPKLVQNTLAHIQGHFQILSNPANAGILTLLGQHPIPPPGMALPAPPAPPGAPHPPGPGGQGTAALMTPNPALHGMPKAPQPPINPMTHQRAAVPGGASIQPPTPAGH